MLRTELAVVSVLVAAAAAACGDSSIGSTFVAPHGNGSDSGTGAGVDSGTLGGEGGAFTGDASVVDSLVFDPPQITVTVSGTSAPTASYSLKATKDGSTFAVTPQQIQFDRPDLASAQIGAPVVLTPTGDYAGTGTLHGVYGGKEAIAQLTVIVALQEIGPGVDPGAVTALGGSGLTQDPSVSSFLYPYDQTIFPLGITTPLLMWSAPSASDVYRIHLEEQNFTYDGYFLATMPGQLRVAQDTWDKITASNGGDALKATLSRWDAGSKTAYTSANESWTVAPASLRGAIYYWTTSEGGHMSRIRPGTGALPEVLSGGQCMGCHGVSADGTTLVASVASAPSTDDSPMTTTRAWVSFDLPGATVRTTSSVFAGNVAVNPDGKYVVYGDRDLKIGNTATGQEITTSGLQTLTSDGGTGAVRSGLMTPAFSPDGKKLAAVSGTGQWYHDLVGGQIVVMDFDEGSTAFSNEVGLATATSFPAGHQEIAYPSFTPDSQWLAFHAADHATGCYDGSTCDDSAQQIGSLWLQNVSAAAPIALDRLSNSAPNVADHDLSLEPTFNPVERGGYFWVVFTSMRDWGNEITGTPNNGKKRLWVAAIDKTIGTVDPSHPPFFLEGQEEATTNMRGFWALAQCTPTPAPGAGGGTCKAGFECCSGFCDMGQCVDAGTIACKGVGDACQGDPDCCNAGAVQCINNTCQPVTTK